MKKCYLTNLIRKGEIDTLVVNDGFVETGSQPNPASEVDPKKDFTKKKPYGAKTVNW